MNVRILRRFVLVLGALLVLGACSKGDEAASIAESSGLFDATVTWSQPLQAKSLANQAKVQFVDANGQPLAAELTGFKLFMSSMGHGSIKADQMIFAKSPESVGLWTVERVYFSMGGGADEWVVDITATVKGTSASKRVSIPLEVL